jgi:hypothetical protein
LHEGDERVGGAKVDADYAACLSFFCHDSGIPSFVFRSLRACANALALGVFRRYFDCRIALSVRCARLFDVGGRWHGSVCKGLSINRYSGDAVSRLPGCD